MVIAPMSSPWAPRNSRWLSIRVMSSNMTRMYCARPGHRLVHVEQVFAFAEGVQEHGHRADVEPVGAEEQQMAQDPGDLVEHDADVLRALGHLDAEQAQYI